MRATRFGINLLLIVLPLVLLYIGASRYVRGVFVYLNTDARLAGTLSAEATRLLGREVKVGDVHITGNLWGLSAKNSIELRDVAIAENSTLDKGVFASVANVRVDYSLQQMLLESNLRVPLVTNIRAIRPLVVLIRNAKGEWNFAKLIKPGGAPGRPFTDRIQVTDGTLLYDDALFPVPPGVPQRRFVTRVDHADGALQLRDSQNVAFDVAASGIPGYIQSFHTVGILRLHPLLLSARLTTRQMNLPALAARFVPAKQAQIGRGTADADLDVLYTPQSQNAKKIEINALDVHGKIAAQNLDVFAPTIGTPLRNANLTASFTRNLLRATVSTQAAGAKIDLDGVAALEWKQKITVRHFAVQAHLQNADLKRLRTAFQIEKRLAKPLASLSPTTRRDILRADGQGDIAVRVAGTPQKPTADLTLNMARLTAAGYGVKNLVLSADYADDLVHADLRAQFGKGVLALRGQGETTGKRTFRVAGRGRDLDLAAFRISGKQKLAGIGKLDIAVSGAKGQTPKLQVQAALDNVRYRGQTLRSVYAVAETVGDKLALRTVRIDDPKGFALASGTVDLRTRQLDIRVGANELDLSRLRTALQTANPKALKIAKTPTPEQPNATAPLSLTGSGYLRGKLTGTLTNPRLRTQLNLFGVESGEYGLDRVTATLDVTKDSIVVAQGTASRYPGTVRFSGLVAEPFNPDPELSLSASVDNLDLTDLARLAGVNADDALITGSVSTEEDIQIEGKTGALRVRRPIHLRFDDASVNGLALRDAAVEATYDGKQIIVNNAGFTVAGGRISATGSVTKDGGLDLKVKGETLGLEDLAFALPLTIADIKKVQGTIDFQANVTGTTKDPKADVTLTGNGLIYNTYALGSIEAKATYENRIAHIPAFTLTSPVGASGKRGELTVTGVIYNLDSKALDGTIRWKEFSIEQMRELYANTRFAETEAGIKVRDLLNQFTTSIQGMISGSMVVGGTANAPEATITWDIRDVRAGRYAFTSLTGSAKATNEKFVIPAPSLPDLTLKLDFPAGIVEAKNISVTFGGAITGEMRADNLDLSIVKQWLPDNNVAKEITGTGDIFIQASGTTDDPQLQLSYLNLHNLGYKTYSIDRIEVLNALITEGKIQADNIRISKTDRERNIKYQANAGGTIGFTFAPPFIPANASLDFTASLLNQDIRALVAPDTRFPNASEGTFSLSAFVRGTRSAPDLLGIVLVDAPRLQFGRFSTGLRDVKGKINLDQDKIVVDNFQAYSQIYMNGQPASDKPKINKPKIKGKPSNDKSETDGLITLSGSLPLGIGNEGEPGGIAIQAPKFMFDELSIPNAPNGKINGQANINLKLIGSVIAPTLAGKVTVTNAQFALPSDFVGISQDKVILPIPPTLDVTVQLAENVRLSNPQLNALTDGDIRLFGTVPDFQLRGNLFLREGSLNLPTARFKIVPTGEVTIAYPTYQQGLGNQLEPTLGLNVNLKAQTKVSARSISGIQRNYKVTVSAVGPLTGGTVDPVTGRSRLALNFQSDPPDLAANQDQMFQKLVGVLGGENLELFSRNPGQAFAAQLTSIFTSSVIPGLFDRAAQSAGFEELSIGYDPVQRLNLTVSRHLFGPFYASYNRSLSGAQEQYRVRLSARFTDRYQASFETNERSEQRYLLEGVWRF